MQSVIFANLSRNDYRNFEKHGISYSGSTGESARTESYGGLAPYIATFDGEFSKAIRAMEWDAISIDVSGNQWIVRGKNVRGKQERIDKLRKDRAEILKALCDNGNELAEALKDAQ